MRPLRCLLGWHKWRYLCIDAFEHGPYDVGTGLCVRRQCIRPGCKRVEQLVKSAVSRQALKVILNASYGAMMKREAVQEVTLPMIVGGVHSQMFQHDVKALYPMPTGWDRWLHYEAEQGYDTLTFIRPDVPNEDIIQLGGALRTFLDRSEQR